jgi:hypothetical protein
MQGRIKSFLTTVLRYINNLLIARELKGHLKKMNALIITIEDNRLRYHSKWGEPEERIYQSFLNIRHDLLEALALTKKC